MLFLTLLKLLGLLNPLSPPSQWVSSSPLEQAGPTLALKVIGALCAMWRKTCVFRARLNDSLPESMCFPALPVLTFCDSPAVGNPWDLNSPRTVGSGQLCPQNALDFSRLGMGGHTELSFF